ncbi:hypothetical protein [Cytobacillus sp. FSL H8-0458]
MTKVHCMVLNPPLQALFARNLEHELNRELRNTLRSLLSETGSE